MSSLVKHLKSFNLAMGLAALLFLALAWTFLPAHHRAQAGERQAAVEAATAEAPAPLDRSAGLAFIAAAIATGMGSIGAGIAVSGVGTAAVGAVAEKSEVMGKALIYVALAEGIAIYGLLVSIIILAKI